MLRTGKQVWEANAKRQALAIRMKELDFHIARYRILVYQMSGMIGFAFLSLIHLRHFPEWLHDSPAVLFFHGMMFMCVMLSAYTIVCANTLVALGKQLSLLGEEGDSVEKAVGHMRNRRVQLFGSAFLALACLIASFFSLAYIKLGWYIGKEKEWFGPGAARLVVGALVTFAAAMAVTVLQIFTAIGHDSKLITGSAKLVVPDGHFELQDLQPGVADRTPFGCIPSSNGAAASALGRDTSQ